MRPLLFVLFCLPFVAAAQEKAMFFVEYAGFSDKDILKVKSMHEIFSNRLAALDSTLLLAVPPAGDSAGTTKGKSVFFKVTNLGPKWSVMLTERENGRQTYFESFEVNAEGNVSIAIDALASAFHKREPLSIEEKMEYAKRYTELLKGKFGAGFSLAYFRPFNGKFTNNSYRITERHGYTDWNIPDSIKPVLDTTFDHKTIAGYDYSLHFAFCMESYDLRIVWTSMDESAQFLSIGYYRKIPLSENMCGIAGLDLGIGFIADDQYDNRFTGGTSDIGSYDRNNGPTIRPSIGLRFMPKEQVSLQLLVGAVGVLGSEVRNYGAHMEIGMQYTFR
jgi:hypothetical protein